jgi:hypothetical protein
MGQAMDIFPPKWDEIPNSYFGSHFFDSLVSISRTPLRGARYIRKNLLISASFLLDLFFISCPPKDSGLRIPRDSYLGSDPARYPLFS